MDYTPKQLAYTGAGVAVGSTYVGGLELVGLAAALVAAGAIAVRYGFRRGKTVEDA